MRSVTVIEVGAQNVAAFVRRWPVEARTPGAPLAQGTTDAQDETRLFSEFLRQRTTRRGKERDQFGHEFEAGCH